MANEEQEQLVQEEEDDEEEVNDDEGNDDGNEDGDEDGDDGEVLGASARKPIVLFYELCPEITVPHTPHSGGFLLSSC